MNFTVPVGGNLDPAAFDPKGIWAKMIAEIESEVSLRNQEKIEAYHDAVAAVRQKNIAHALHKETLEPDPSPYDFKLGRVHEDVMWDIFNGTEQDWSKAVTYDVVPPLFVIPDPTPAPLGNPLPVASYPGFYEIPGDNANIPVGAIRSLNGVNWIKTYIPGTNSWITGSEVEAWVKEAA